MDRLLSDKDMCKLICDDGSWDKCPIKDKTEACFKPYDHDKIRNAQLAKTDAEWIEWIEINHPDISYKECTESHCKRTINTRHCLNTCAYLKWEERKKELDANNEN